MILSASKGCGGDVCLQAEDHHLLAAEGCQPTTTEHDAWHRRGRQKRRRLTVSWILFFVLMLVLCRLKFVVADKASSSGAVNKPISLATSPSSSRSATTTGGILQVVESEVWDSSGNEWKGAPGERWTNEMGASVASPSAIDPPDGFVFDGDWKIVVPSNGDAMGWEYQFQYLRAPRRRRIWLRSLRPIQLQQRLTSPPPPKHPKRSQSTSVGSILSAQKSLMTRVRDDWNFKGFAMSLYKSLIFPESFGIGVQLPLTVNFDYFDSHPEFPSVSCGTAIFFPGTIMGSLSASIHVDWIKWVLKSSLAVLPLMILWTTNRILIPILWTMVTFVLFPIRDRLPELSSIMPNMIPYGSFIISKPQYSSEISERVGCSISYRYSMQGGYEFRISCSHSYLPTLLVYQRLLAQTQHQMKALTRISTLWKRSRKNERISIAAESFEPIDLKQGWWQKHFARIGVSTAYPIPSPPHFSCSAILSLSGLYFGTKKEQNKATALMAGSTTAATGITMSRSATTSAAPQDENNSLPMLPIEEGKSHRDFDLASSGGKISH